MSLFWSIIGFLLKEKNKERKISKKEISKINNILIVNVQGMGDILMLTPLIKSLAKSSKKVDILLKGKLQEIVLKNNKSINKTIQFEGLKTVKKINKKKYDLIYLSQGSGAKSGLLYLLLRAKNKASHINNLGGFWTSFRSNIRMKKTAKLHRVEEHLKLAKFLGLKIKEKSYEFNISKEAEKKAKEILKKHKLTNKKIIGIHPGGDSSNPEKRFPIEKYISFSNSLKKEKAIFFIGPDEKELESILRKAKQTVIKTDIETIAALLKKCEYVLQSDSGLGHLAAAVGTKTKTIVGATNWLRTKPYGSKDTIIKKKGIRDPEDSRMEEKNIIKEKNYFIKKI